MISKKLTKEVLAEMIADDEYGLLDIKARAKASTADELLVRRFNEILEFVEKHNRKPELNKQDIGEYKLAARLEGINASEDYRTRLAYFDLIGLLVEPEAPKSLEEIFEDDEFGLLDDDEDIFTLKHVPKPERAKPDEVAQRTKCEDFDDFKDLFTACHNEIKHDVRKLSEFRNPNNIEVGKFFVSNGVLVYVAEINDERIGSNGLRDGRTRSIYENGTESTLLVQSLAKNLYDGGKIVTEPVEVSMKRMKVAEQTNIGCVYVLKTKSDDPQLLNFANVHKIGSTKQAADKRTAKALKSSTFLNSPVEIVQEYEMPAVAVRGLEKLLHDFFAEARLDIWFERQGKKVSQANEWFDVSYNLIDEAIDLINSGTIGNYYYDRDTEQIVLN